MVFGISLLFLLLGLVSAVRLNEIMPNPNDGCDDCTEWIELYANSSTSLINWIINTTNEKTNFSYDIDDYLIITKNKTVFIQKWPNVNEGKIIEWKSISLKNDDGEGVFLFDNTLELKDSVDYPDFSGSSHGGDTYSLLANSSWIICDEPTPGSANSCEPQQQNLSQTQDPEIYLEVDWDEDEIINGEEFDIKIKAFNLEDEEYNIKVYITFEDNDTVISERYDKENGEWKSGTYYVDKFFSGSGNKSENIKLRIRSNYNEFYGDALLNIKIEGENYDFNGDIEILKKEDEEKGQDIVQEAQGAAEEKTEDMITGSVIKLVNKKDETKESVENEKEESKILYESGSEKVKKYAIYGLNIILVIIIIFLLTNKKVLKAKHL